MPIDFQARGYLERKSAGSYKHVKDGTLKELAEYVCERSDARIGEYRITAGKDIYTGKQIRALQHLIEGKRPRTKNAQSGAE